MCDLEGGFLYPDEAPLIPDISGEEITCFSIEFLTKNISPEPDQSIEEAANRFRCRFKRLKRCWFSNSAIDARELWVVREIVRKINMNKLREIAMTEFATSIDHSRSIRNGAGMDKIIVADRKVFFWSRAVQVLDAVLEGASPAEKLLIQN